MRIILIISFFSINSLMADKIAEPEAEFNGIGLVKASPDIIKVSISVKSECYASPAEAQSGTDQIVKKIDDYLQTLKSANAHDFKILVDGGYTTTFSKWHNQRELCSNTFQKSTEISVKMAATKNFDKIFSDLQTYLLKYFDQGLPRQDYEKPRTYLRISAPIPELRPQHKRELERQAINLAMLDAKDKFLAAMKSCRAHPWKVVRMKEEVSASYESPRPYYAAAKMSMVSHESSYIPAPVRFDDLSIEKRLAVTFGFEASMCYEP